MPDVEGDTIRPLSRVQKVVFSLVASVHVLISFHEIARPFFTGHHGWNAALRTLIARNYVEHGFLATGLAPYKQFGVFSSLENAPIHWNHPPLANIMVGLSFEVFGVETWAAHLTAAIPAALLVFVLFDVVRRRWGNWTAIAASLFLAVSPMQVEWGKMLNYEVQIVFFTMLSIAFMDRYVSSSDRRRVIFAGLTCLALCVAGAYDWPGFIMAAFVGTSALFREPKRPWLFLAIGVTTGATLAFHFWWLDGMASGEGLIGLAKWRSSSKITFEALAQRSWERLGDYYGTGLLIAAAVGTIACIAEKRRIDVVVWTFFVGNVLYISIFKQAAWVHVFYLYFTAPAFASAAAIGVRALFRLARPLGQKAPVIVALLAVFGTTVPAILLLPTTHARSYGILPPKYPSKGFPRDGELDRAVVGMLLNEVTSSDETIAIHPRSGASLQLRVYAYRRYKWHRSRRPPRDVGAWLVPQKRVSEAVVSRLAETERVIRIDRWLIIDFDSNESGVTHLAIVKDEPSLIHDYFVSSIVPPWKVVERDP